MPERGIAAPVMAPGAVVASQAPVAMRDAARADDAPGRAAFPHRSRVAVAAGVDLATLALVTLALAFAVIGVAMAAGIDLEHAADSVGEVAFLAGIGLALWLLQRRRPLPAWPAAPPRSGSAEALAIGLALGAAVLCCGELAELAASALGLTPVAGNEALVRASLAAQPLLNLVLVGVAAPLAEEAAIRGRLFGRFLRAGFPWLGGVLTSALFAGLHEFGPDAGQRLVDWCWLTLQYGVMGGVFAWGYARTRRLATPVLAHALNNTVLCALVLGGWA